MQSIRIRASPSCFGINKLLNLTQNILNGLSIFLEGNIPHGLIRNWQVSPFIFLYRKIRFPRTKTNTENGTVSPFMQAHTKPNLKKPFSDPGWVNLPFGLTFLFPQKRHIDIA